MIMLEAQFGTIPTIAERTFARMGLSSIILAIASSPMKCIQRLSANVTSKINPPTLTVCIRAGFTIPWWQ